MIGQLVVNYLLPKVSECDIIDDRPSFLVLHVNQVVINTIIIIVIFSVQILEVQELVSDVISRCIVGVLVVTNPSGDSIVVRFVACTRNFVVFGRIVNMVDCQCSLH